MRERRQVVIFYRPIGGGLGQGDIKGAVLFNNFLIKSFNFSM